MAKFRKLIASLGIVAILSTLVVSSTAFAAFSDVPANAWYAGYVDTLSTAGVLDTTKSTLNPGGNLNRAEALKLAVEVCGSTGTTDVPFADVKSTDWFYSYVQTGVAKGITSGYPDGTFKPGKSVNRAEFAKFLVNACDLTESTAHPFTDVKTGDWFNKAVGTAYHWMLVDGATATTYNPAGDITRAASFKMSAQAMDPKERPATAVSTADSSTPASTADSAVVPAGPVGDLTVSLSSNSPKGVTLPASASSVEVAVWDFKAGSVGDATIKSIDVAKYGVASLASGHYLYLYDGPTRLTSGRTVNASTNVATFNNVSITVPKGTTKTISLLLDTGATATTGEVGFELTAAASITAGESAVGGTFPIKGELFGLSTTAVGTVTIAKNGTIQNPKVGEDDVTIAKFKMSVATEGATLKSLGIYLTGGISPEAVENFELYVAGEDDPIATAEGLSAKDVALFVPATPYHIDKGATKSFWVKADLNTGRVDDTVKVYIDETTDVVAIGETYGFGMQISMNTAVTGYDGTTTACTSAGGTCSFSTVEGGDITTTSSGPTAGNIAINGDNIVIMNFNIASVADVTFKNFPISITTNETGRSLAGLLKTAGSSTGSNFTDIKVINTETNETLMGPIDANVLRQTTGTTGTAITETLDTSGFYVFQDQFDMSAGETLKLALTLDIENNSTLDASTIYTAINYDASFPEVRDVNNKTLTNSATLVPSSAVTGKTMTVSTPKLTLTRASTPVSDSYVKGQKDVKFTGISFACGTGSSCKVTDVTLGGNYDNSGSDTWSTSGSQGSVRLNSRVGSVSLQDSTGNVIAAAKGVQANGTVAFTSINWSLKAGETAIAYVVGDISSNAAGGESISFGVQAITNVTYEDKDGTTRNPVAGSTPNRGGAAGTDPDTFVSVLAGGSLTIAVDAGTTKEDIVIAGTADNAISKFKFTTTEEAFIVKKLSVNARQSAVTGTTTLGNYDNNISSIKLSYTNSTGAVETKTAYLTNGNANFSGLDMAVAKDNDALLTVSATLNSISGGATAGEFVDLNLAFHDFEATAQSSGELYTGAKINSTVDSASDLDFGSITFIDTIDASASAAITFGALGAATTVTVDDGNATVSTTATPVFPVGTILCFDPNVVTGGDDTLATGSCQEATDSMVIVTAFTDGTGTTADSYTTLTVNNVDAAIADATAIYYALPGTGYLTSAKQMVVYETKPTVSLASTSPSGGKTAAAGDNIFIFTVAAPAQEKVQVRTAKHLTTCVSGAGTPVITTPAGTPSIDGSSCVVDVAVTVADTIAYTQTAGELVKYSRVNFWMRWSDDSATAPSGHLFTNLKTGVGTVAATAIAADHDAALAAADCTAQGTSANAVAATISSGVWYNCDIAMSATVDSADTQYYIELDAFTGLDAADEFYFDRVIAYNDKIRLNLSGDDIDTQANGAHTLAATLKDGGSTIATGYVAKTTSVEAEGGSARVDFFPLDGTDAAIEIAKGTSKSFTLQLNSDTLLAQDTGSDDPLTVSMALGSSTDGTVTAGDFWWNDTNGITLTTFGSQGVIKWVGQVANTTLNGNSLKY